MDYIDDSMLSKLANKAKNKLSKKTENESSCNENKETCVLKKSSRAEDLEILKQKIKKLIKECPDCDDPIGRLVDHSVYDKLNKSEKERYILKLSSDYNMIRDSLKS